MRRSIGTSSRGNMRHGLISLLTVVVIMSLATAAVLAISTAHAMAALSERQAAMTVEGYAAERSAQAFLAGLDEALSDVEAGSQTSASGVMAAVESSLNRTLATACAPDVTATFGVEDTTITCTFVTKGGRMLQTSVTVGADATYDIVGWRLTAAPQEEDTGDMLWTGSTDGE